MLVFYNNETGLHVYIHIPKNSGKYLRGKILKNTNNKKLLGLWGYDRNQVIDTAHVPYLLRKLYILNDNKHNYFTYSRNPYDRLISIFFYKYPKKTKNDFKNYVKNILPTIEFSLDYHRDKIHFYPQYLFVCDKTLNVAEEVTVSKLEDSEKPTKYNLSEYYTNEIIEITNQIYEKDFLYFGYDMITSLDE